MKQCNFLAILIIILAGCYSSSPQKTGKEGKTMPEFKLLLTDSITWITTNQQSTGQSTVLFYFSPFCPYCKAQTKEILEDIKVLNDIHFYFISNFPISNLKAFSKEFKLNKYPNITIGMDVSKSVGDYFEIIGVPFTAIYGKDKKLNKSFLGGKIYSSQIKKISEE